MPSLQQLEEFSSSFRNIGGEASAEDQPFEEYPLPETEPPEPFPPNLFEPPSSGGLRGPEDQAAGQGEAPDAEEGGLGDLDDFLGSMGDLAAPVEETALDETDAGMAGIDEIPEAASGADLQMAAGEALPGDLLGDLDDFTQDEATAGEGEEVAESPAGDEGPVPGDFSPDNFDLGDIKPQSGAEPAEEAGGKSAAPPESSPEDFAAVEEPEGTAPLDDAPDFSEGLEPESPAAEAAPSPDEAGIDLGGETAFPDAAEVSPPAEEPAAADGFDNFSLGGDAADFSLAGFDEHLTEESPALAAAGASAEEVEEIQLSEEEFARLQETLSAYPLNLRIACEEIIAEQAVAPQLMSALVKLLARGGPARGAASLAGRILNRTITVPRGLQTGENFEEEQASLGYLFVHKFLPVLRIILFAGLVLFVLGYLSWRYIINPFIANGDYEKGYKAISAGEYNQANDLFLKAFRRHAEKKWFYRYAEAFRDVRHYPFAERKYDELLRVYPRDKKGALDYAFMETNNLKNYEKADRILRENILDYMVDDREALIALGENNLAWGEENPARYEEARAAYARLIARYGRQDPFLEGMLKYFIRTDKLNEVIPLQRHFMNTAQKHKIAVPTLAELGGYLLDKKFEDVRGVPDEYVELIDGIPDVLQRAIKTDRSYPESYYHLARYYSRYGTGNDQRAALESAIRLFDAAQEESPRRAGYKIDSYRRYAEVLVNAEEFFPAAEQFARGIRLYEDARARGVLSARPEFGRLYAGLGDLVFYGQDGDVEAALRHYAAAEANGWSPPEMQYRIGAANYELGQWEEALRRFFAVSGDAPNNRRLLYALGNASYLRGDYFAAQSYYTRLMDLLDADRVRFPNLAPGSRPEEQDLAERIMVADNNLGVTLEMLAMLSGNTGYRGRALGLFAESIRAWDVLTRNPDTMSRMRPIRDLYGPGVNLAYLNSQNVLHPVPNYDLQIFMRIDRDMMEPSAWELLVPRDYRLSENLFSEQAQAANY